MTETCIYFSIPTHEEAVQMCDSGFWATSYRLLRLCVNLCAQARTVSLCEAGLYLYLLYRSRTGHELSLHCQTQMQHLYTVCLHPFCRHFIMLANIVRRLRHLTVRPCDDEQQIGNEGEEGWTMNGAFHASPPKPESLNGHVFSWTFVKAVDALSIPTIFMLVSYLFFLYWDWNISCTAGLPCWKKHE